MLIARWQLGCRFGKADDCVSILRRWEIDVGEWAGWKPASVRILVGQLGGDDSTVEFEARFESLGDLEAVWRDIEQNPHHREYLKRLEPLLGGASRWTILREVDLVGGER